MVINKTRCISNIIHWYIYKRLLIWNRNNKVQSRDLSIPSLPVLPNDLPLPLPFRFYPLPYVISGHCVYKESQNPDISSAMLLQW